MIACGSGCGYCGRCNDDIDDLRPNAECSDCGIAYGKADDDPTTWCDACSDRRDTWAAAFEIRVMAKAFLRADLSKVRDVA
jgi:hypothetical protein